MSLSPDYNEKGQKNSCCSCGRDNSRAPDGKDIGATLTQALKRVAASDKPRASTGRARNTWRTTTASCDSRLRPFGDSDRCISRSWCVPRRHHHHHRL